MGYQKDASSSKEFIQLVEWTEFSTLTEQRGTKESRHFSPLMQAALKPSTFLRF